MIKIVKDFIEKKYKKNMIKMLKNYLNLKSRLIELFIIFYVLTLLPLFSR